MPLQPAKLINWQRHNDSYTFTLFLESESMINEVKRAETGCPQDIMQKFLATAIGENDA